MKLKWEHVKHLGAGWTARAKVPGGWFVVVNIGSDSMGGDSGAFFYPDPNHTWDGNSLA